jgi:hypothetical protein
MIFVKKSFASKLVSLNWDSQPAQGENSVTKSSHPKIKKQIKEHHEKKTSTA